MILCQIHAFFSLLILTVLASWGLLGAAPAQETLKLKQIEQMIAGFEKEANVPTVSVAELKVWLRGAGQLPVLVDVRPENERKIATLPQAISLQEFTTNPARYVGRKVVSFCTIGYRSALQTAQFRELGFDAWNLRGSLLLWVHSGAEVVDASGQATRRVHVYGKKWDLLPDGYEAIYPRGIFDSLRH